MKHQIISITVTILLMGGGCSRKVTDSGVELNGEAAKAGSSLAYEHTARISLAEDSLHERIEQARVACVERRFGACNLLELEEASGANPSGKLVVRIVPEGVEPLTTFASEGGQIVSKSTRAEDLAEVVADSTRQTEELELKRANLLEFQTRNDLSVTDMISLAKELAAADLQLTEVNRAASLQQRRIETNSLTILFSANLDPSPWSGVRVAVSGAIGSLADGMAEAIGALAFGLPFLLIAFPVALLWRYLWRRVTSRGSYGRN